MVVATFVGGCAAELDGKPEDYTKAYEIPMAAGSPSTGMAGAGAGGSGSGGGPASSGGSPSASGGAPASNNVPPDPACLSMVISANCSSCHSASLALGGFNMAGSNLGQRFSTLKATYEGVTDMEKCKPNALIINPANPSESVLLKKIKGTQDCGTPMPLGAPLSGAPLKCFEDWINSFGASANWSSFEDEGGSGGDSL